MVLSKDIKIIKIEDKKIKKCLIARLKKNLKITKNALTLCVQHGTMSSRKTRLKTNQVVKMKKSLKNASHDVVKVMMPFIVKMGWKILKQNQKNSNSWFATWDDVVKEKDFKNWS